MGKSTISMAIFNSFLYVYQRVSRPVMLPGSPHIDQPVDRQQGAIGLWQWLPRLVDVALTEIRVPLNPMLKHNFPY